MSTHRNTVSRRLITPSSWGKKDSLNANAPSEQRACRHCGHRGLNEESTIAGQMFRCPACKKLQF
ncbi:MAG: hypothetical protein JO171_07220 [Paludibacterium sp.]|uniref:hypothetical protein n=1 Tax=Paludibacterium sp. TaxID=1917523 RepID=UPI0025FADE93|nr:hypothetical protein [Paludibacterium sp.]MBV8046925.1 hypothetical protein [Paludibacterium sp.]MBV8646518.1 hypothetical protein [Paludibacterium sp.]